MQPVIFKGRREVSGEEVFELMPGGGDVFFGDDAVPGVASDQGGKVVSAGGLAGAVEADDASGGVVDSDQRSDRVEDGGDEVALDGEGGFDPVAGGGGAIHLADAGFEFELLDDLAGEGSEGSELGFAEASADGIEDAEAADDDSGGGDEGGSGKEAVLAAAEEDSGAAGRVEAGVGDLVDLVGCEGFFETDGPAGDGVGGDAEGGVDVEVAGGGEDDRGNRGVGDLGGEATDVLKGWIGWRAEDAVLFEGLQTGGFVPGIGIGFGRRGIHRGRVHLCRLLDGTERRAGSLCNFRWSGVTLRGDRVSLWNGLGGPEGTVRAWEGCSTRRGWVARWHWRRGRLSRNHRVFSSRG